MQDKIICNIAIGDGQFPIAMVNERVNIMFTKLVSKIIIIAAIFTFSCCLAFSADVEMKTVTAQGVGIGADKAKARDEAIQDAQRKAVEVGVGLYIKSETIVANFTLVSDNIYKESAGFVHTYTIENEGYDANNEFYRVTIKAQVSMQKLELALDNLYDKLKIAGNPRVLIAIAGTQSLSDPDGVANSLTNAMIEKGFKVFDEDQLNNIRQKDALRLIMNGNVESKTIMLLQDKADIIITGKVSATTAERIFADPTTYSQCATLDAKVIRVDTAQVIGAKRGQGVGADFTAKGSLQAAEDKAGINYYENNKLNLLRAVLDPCKEYTIKVVNCSYGQLNQVDNKLADNRFIRSKTEAVYEEGDGEGYGIMTVYFNGNAKMLATHLETATGIKLAVKSVTNMTITVKPIKN